MRDFAAVRTTNIDGRYALFVNPHFGIRPLSRLKSRRKVER